MNIHAHLRNVFREYEALWAKYKTIPRPPLPTHDAIAGQFGALRGKLEILAREIDAHTAVTLTTEGGARSALVRDVICDCAIDQATKAWETDPHDCDEPIGEDFDALEIALRGKPTPLDKEYFNAAWQGYIKRSREIEREAGR